MAAGLPSTITVTATFATIIVLAHIGLNPGALGLVGFP
jgi:ketopantoate hydroxymethyltransferase